MGTITVELCGRLADLLSPSVEWPVGEDGLSVAALRTALIAAHPVLDGALSAAKARACVDEAMVGEDALVLPGQVIAFFPPLSGG